MGNLLDRVKTYIPAIFPVKARILLLGLNSSGKTTVLYQLKLNEKVTTTSTIGFNVETLVPINGVSFTIWDVSLNPQTWPFYKHYFENTQGMVFVVDCNDSDRHADAKQLLYMILGEADLEGVPFVVLANKQDLEEAKRPSDLAVDLELEKLDRHSWMVFSCCATSGEGLQEALSTLAVMVKERGVFKT